jgi:hypothetical protein
MHFGIAAILPHPNRYSFQTGVHTHILPDPDFLRFMNHSCVPNVFVNTKEMCVLAVNVIEPGDEIVCFYPSTEWLMKEPFLCCCGSPQCLGRIQGAAYIADGILSKYHVADHIKLLLGQGEDA